MTIFSRQKTFYATVFMCLHNYCNYRYSLFCLRMAAKFLYWYQICGGNFRVRGYGLVRTMYTNYTMTTLAVGVHTKSISKTIRFYIRISNLTSMDYKLRFTFGLFSTCSWSSSFSMALIRLLSVSMASSSSSCRIRSSSFSCSYAV